MAHAVTLIIFLACVVLSHGKVQPGQCAFYEECGENPSIVAPVIPAVVPCLSYTPARFLSGEHYLRLKKVCPMLDCGENNTYACCSIKQLRSLEMSLTMSKAVLIRCPSCAENFAHMHCINTCSPNQTQTVNVTATTNLTSPLGQVREVVVGYQAYFSAAFAERSFKSCQKVRIPGTERFAISTMCGRYGAKLCTAQRWYDFQGDSSNGLASLDIDFKLIQPEDMATVPVGIVPYNGRTLRCNETTPTGGAICSCQDCPESCPAMPPPPIPARPFRLMGTDGFLVISRREEDRRRREEEVRMHGEEMMKRQQEGFRGNIPEGREQDMRMHMAGGHGMPMNRNSMGGNAGPAGNPPMSAENTSLMGPGPGSNNNNIMPGGGQQGGFPRGLPGPGDYGPNKQRRF